MTKEGIASNGKIEELTDALKRNELADYATILQCKKMFAEAIPATV